MRVGSLHSPWRPRRCGLGTRCRPRAGGRQAAPGRCVEGGLQRKVSWRGAKGDRAVDLFDGADLAGKWGRPASHRGDHVGHRRSAGCCVAVRFVIPAVIFFLELVLVLAAVGLGVLGRVLFRRPWTVEARVDGTDRGGEWKVTGWRASGELVDSMAERLQSTGQLGGARQRHFPGAP